MQWRSTMLSASRDSCQMRALFPPCRRTPVSTIRQKYLISCPATRPAGPSGSNGVSGKPARPSRAAQRRARGSAMATCPEAPETRPLPSRPGTWSCVSRGRETPGGRGYSNMSQGQEEDANQQYRFLGVLEAEPEHQQEEGLGANGRSSIRPVAMAAHSPHHRRYLVFLNLLHCALLWGFILGPTTLYGRSNSSKPLKFGGNDSVLDFFLGSGYLDRSPVFYGFYTRGSLHFQCLNTPLLYLAGMLVILFLSLILVVRRMTVGYKHAWMLGKRYSTNVSYKIFCGWDFTIQDPEAATLKHSFIRNNVKLFLEEQSFSLREAQRTLRHRVRLYLLRCVLNLLVLSLLGGAFFLIYFATKASQQESGNYWLLSLVLEYLPPITITFVNLLLPRMFRKISSFEDYSFTMQVNATLVRSIFLKLASLGMYLFFIFTTRERQKSSFHCRENAFGREMYKLCIFNFLFTFCDAFLLNYPRKLLQEKYPSSLLARLSGKQRFLIPFNVLDLVYSQTVSWVGVYYCPLLPLIGTATLMATFYIQKFTVLRCCVPQQRMFRGSSSSVLFHFMLLLGLLMAATTLGLNLYQPQATQEGNMSSCGPFGNGETVFNVTGVCVNSLPSPAQTTLRYLASEAFALPLILAEILILTSYVSRRRANQKAIERLKDMLVMSSSDKRFLVKQNATLLRGQRKAHGVGSGAIEEDAHPPSPSLSPSHSPA